MIERPEAITVCASPSTDTKLQTRVAAELDRICHELEEIGVSLCADHELVQRCIIQLQRLDELGQRSRWLARLIDSDDPHRLISEITLGSLAARLAA